MHRNWASLALVMVALLATACTPTATATTLPEAQILDATQAPEAASMPKDAQPVVEINGDQLDIYLVTPLGERIAFGSLSAVTLSYDTAYQYAAGAFYYLQRSGDINTDAWTDELWRLDADGQGAKLFESQGMSFDVAPSGETIAVSYLLDPDAYRYSLQILDAQGASLQTLTFDEVNPDLALSLEGWSDTGDLFWVSFSWGPAIQEYAQVGVPGGQVAHYDTSSLPLQPLESALDFNSGQLVYSDMPVFFEIVGAQQFLVSQQPVTLYLLNLSSGASFPVATSAAKAFHPEWVDGGSFAYDAPDGSGQLVYQVLSGETTLIPGDPLVLPSPQYIPQNFESIMQPLLETGVAIILPPSFPSPTQSPAYPYLSQAIDGQYAISLETTEDCMDTGFCTYGHLIARRIGATGDAAETIMPFDQFDSMTQLTGFIPAYFVDYECGANCSDGKLFWIYGDYEYMLGLEAASIDDLVVVANVMIENSLPEE